MSTPDIFAIVLATGHSRRMGNAHKLLARVQDKPVIRHTVENILRSHVRHVIVVTGHEAMRVESSLYDLPVFFLHNANHASGLASSLVRGIASLKPSAEGALICIGDMTLVSAQTIDRLITAFDYSGRTAICVPTHKGVQANPVLWAKSFFPHLQKLSGDQGAKKLLGDFEKSILRIEMPDEPGIVFDVDTPTDLIQLSEKFSA